MLLQNLQDRIDRGRGTAARHIGASYDAFRPSSAKDPLDPCNRFLRLPAAFSPEDATFRRPAGYGRTTWLGIFDNSYTQPGDYLSGPEGSFFIAAQQSLLPVLCVLTTRTLTISRPAAPPQPGLNTYGGVTLATLTPLLTAWPASVVIAGTGARGMLPGDSSISSWTVLLPFTPLALFPGDLIEDDIGRTYAIGTAELTALGWRLLVKQAVT